MPWVAFVFVEVKVSDRRIPVTLRIDRAVYFKFKCLALARCDRRSAAQESKTRRIYRRQGRTRCKSSRRHRR